MLHNHVLIVCLLLALLVVLAGTFLLSYSKKEGLGKFSKIASFVAIFFGSIIFIGGLICALMCGSCKKEKCGKGAMKCNKEIKMKCHSGMENEMMMNSHFEKSSGSCDKSKMMDCQKTIIIKKVCENDASANCCKEMNGKMECSKNETDKCCKETKTVNIQSNGEKPCCKNEEKIIVKK